MLSLIFTWLSIESWYEISNNVVCATTKASDQPASSLDEKRICLNTQLKLSKNQLKLNVCVPKSNSNYRYAISCDAIAYHLVHFVSIWVINKCQSGIDLFLLASTQYNSSFINKILVPSPVFRGNDNTMMKVKLYKVYANDKCQQGDEICFRYNKIC